MRVSTKVVIDMETGAELERESYEHSGPVEECRGEDKPVAQAALTGANNMTALAGQQEAQANQIQSMILPQYQSMLSNPASATPAGQEAAASFGSAQNTLAARAAKTGNSAGTVEGEDKLAQDKASTLSNITTTNQNNALSGLQSLYGTDTNLLSKTLGLPPEYLNASTNAAAPKGPQPGFSFGPGGVGFSL